MYIFAFLFSIKTSLRQLRIFTFNIDSISHMLLWIDVIKKSFWNWIERNFECVWSRWKITSHFKHTHAKISLEGVCVTDIKLKYALHDNGKSSSWNVWYWRIFKVTQFPTLWNQIMILLKCVICHIVCLSNSLQI